MEGVMVVSAGARSLSVAAKGIVRKSDGESIDSTNVAELVHDMIVSNCTITQAPAADVQMKSPTGPRKITPERA